MELKELKRESYQAPLAHVWMLSRPLNLLVNISAEGEFDPLIDEGEW